MTVWRRAVVGPIGTGLVILAAGLATAMGWLDWEAIARWVGRQAGWLVVFGLASVLIGIGLTRAARRPFTLTGAPALSWWMVAGAGVVVAAVVWGATAWLLGEADRARDPAAARVEAIRLD